MIVHEPPPAGDVSAFAPAMLEAGAGVVPGLSVEGVASRGSVAGTLSSGRAGSDVVAVASVPPPHAPMRRAIVTVDVRSGRRHLMVTSYGGDLAPT